MVPFSLAGCFKGSKRRFTVSRGSSRQAERSARARFRPRLEALEERTVPSYLFSSIDDPNAGTMGGQGTGAFGINERGQIVGQYSDSNFEFHGFLLSGGQFTTIDDPNADPFSSQGALGINTGGEIVGFYTDANFVNHGYLLFRGQYTTLDDPNAGSFPGGNPQQGTVAAGINELGQIVGYYFDNIGNAHGFLLIGGQYITLNDPNAGTQSVQGTFPLGINAFGQIVGEYVDAQFHMHGFLLFGGLYTTLDEPNAVFGTAAEGINELGQIVGFYADDVTVHGFLRFGGQYTTLDEPNAGVFGGTQAGAINDSGQIVGFYIDDNFVEHGFLAIPGSGGPAAAPGGHPGDRLDAPYSVDTTTASSVQSTRNGIEVQSGVLDSAGQGVGDQVEILIAARLTASKHTSITGNDLFTSIDEISKHE